MKARQFVSFVLAAAMMATSLAASAYDQYGHKTVGAIADQLLKGTPTEAAIKAILGGQNLETRAIWADCVKAAGPPNFKFTSSLTYPECDVFLPEATAIESFVTLNWEQCGPPIGGQYCHEQYHYTDISNLRRDYDVHYRGASTNDIVHSINAAIVVLRGQPTPSPYNIAGKPEALTLLAHYVGDIHQPLHTVAIYLDKAGQTVDPEVVTPFRDYDTAGGNSIKLPSGQLFHASWDDISDDLKTTGPKFAQMLSDARSVPRTSGDVMTWSKQWASETIQVGASAFDGVIFKYTNGEGDKKHWSATYVDESAYRAHQDALWQQELTRAGARLAQVLEEVLTPPQTSCNQSPPTTFGYLGSGKLPDVKLWMPTQPAALSIEQVLDDQVFESTRALLATPRGRSGAEDDVYDANQVLARFRPSLGQGAPDISKNPKLIDIVSKLETDASNLVDPVKQKVCAGGRVRPFVAHPWAPTCLTPVDLAGHADDDLVKFKLAESGSFPSTHSMIGLMTGMVLAELFPDRSAELLSRGFEFGQSRVVCGFHYQSDVDAGRLAAAGLMARLQGEPAFRDAVDAVSKTLPKPATR